jgi:integrase
MRTKLTPAFAAKAKAEPDAERTTYWDTAQPGFGLMVTANGHRSFVVNYRAGRISRRVTLKNGLSLSEARRQARGILGDVARGGDPLQESREARAAQSNTLKFIADEYLKREGKTLRARTLKDTQAIFRRYIFARFGSRPLDSIKRSEIVRLLDKIEDENGPTAARHAFATLRRLMNWYAGRSDDFRSPITHGMGRIKEKARQRILSDDELRAVWRAADSSGAYNNLIRFILLTAARLREASDMTRAELNADGSEWLIPAARYKSKHDHLIPLSKAAQDVLAAIPVIGRKGWVFTTNGDVPISGFSKFKAQFDARVLEVLRENNPQAVSLPNWTTHDLRRTARSLMSRAGVNADHAERALGHAIGGVRGVYDRHEYLEEKRHAFEALAGELERIIKPPEPSVVPLRRPAKK